MSNNPRVREAVRFLQDCISQGVDPAAVATRFAKRFPDLASPAARRELEVEYAATGGLPIAVPTHAIPAKTQRRRDKKARLAKRARIAWKLGRGHGHGSWFNDASQVTGTVSKMNRQYGVGTHWVELAHQVGGS